MTNPTITAGSSVGKASASTSTPISPKGEVGLGAKLSNPVPEGSAPSQRAIPLKIDTSLHTEGSNPRVSLGSQTTNKAATANKNSVKEEFPINSTTENYKRSSSSTAPEPESKNEGAKTSKSRRGDARRKKNQLPALKDIGDTFATTKAEHVFGGKSPLPKDL